MLFLKIIKNLLFMDFQEKELSFNLNPQIKIEIQNFTNKILNLLFYQFKKEELEKIKDSFKKYVSFLLIIKIIFGKKIGKDFMKHYQIFLKI